jgi:succinate-semialdehyde dehydrogenase/glutarate-semialdehyde dehydrogenase
VGVNLSADILDYYADNGEAFLADKNLNPESGKAIIRNSNWVLFGVMPWNFPFLSGTVCCPNIMVETPYY